MADNLCIGVDVGGTNLRFGVFRGAECLRCVRREVDLRQRCAAASDAEAAREIVLTALGEGIHELLPDFPEVARVGLAFPGFVDHDGVLLKSPNIPQLENFALQRELGERLGLRVVAENDANAAAYGEFWEERQAHPELQDLLFVGLGTGVGGGWVHHCRPWRGAHGAAMEIGHLIVVPGGRRCGCGNQGCLEQYASARGVQASYVEATGTAPEPAVIAQMARDGHAEARAAFALAGQCLGQALAHVLKVADIGLLRVGGGLSAAWDCFAEDFLARLDQDLIPALRGSVEVKRGNNDDLAGMRGAALLANDDPRRP